MNPDELRALLEKLGRFLETAGGGYSRRLPDVPQEQRTIGRADPRNVPVSADELAALPRKRVTKADKAIGALADLTPVASAEALRQAIHHAKAGKYGNAALLGAMAAMDLVPGEGAAAEKAVVKAVAKGHPEIQAIMREMQHASGGRNLPRITAIDPEKGRLLARAYESLPVNDPNAKRAYDALNREVAAQKKRFEDAGFKFEFVDEDPYKSSKEMMADVAQNRRLKVFKTGDDAAHPYMTKQQNDDFRAVHDLLAHAGEGHQFGPVGEENAFRVHASTLSPEALPALASETRGQNSWVNFGPNAHLPVRERPFAEQKAALFPSHLTGDYDAMTPEAVDALPSKYAILTAENPHGRPASPERNAQHNLALEKHLAKMGLKFEKVKGAYTDDATGNLLTENSYLIPGLEPHEAERLGRQFGQNGVVTHAGYHDLAGNKLHPSTGISFADDHPYTELPDGRRIRSNIDWERHNPLLTPDVLFDAEPKRGYEEIRHAALKLPDGRVVTGRSHLDAALEAGFPYGDVPRGTDEGWVTESGRYLTRDEVDGLDSHEFRANNPPQVRAMGDSVAARPVLQRLQAAIRFPDGETLTGKTHFDAIQKTDRSMDELAMGYDGFDLDGKFLSREEATKLLQEEGALPRDFPRPVAAEEINDLRGAAGDSLSARTVDWAAKHRADGDAVSRFKDVARDIRAFPDQRRNDLIDALRGEPYMRPDPYRAPAVITRDRWKPTSRGVFPRDKGAELYREPAPLPFEAKAKPKSTGLHPVAEQIANDPRVIQRILADVEKGRDIGGLGWYGLKELRDFIEAEGGPFSFRDVNMAGAAGSARTPTHNELTNMSLNLFGRKRGLDTEEARQVYLWMHPGTMRPTYMNTHRQIFDRGVERGVMGPNKPTDGALKIPHYFHNRQLGANGIPIDTHEQRMLSQATGISMDDIKAAMKAGGNNYEAMTQPYHRVAEMLGMTPDQVQASRWLGGGLQTGLKSQPKGDFLQTLEDGLLYTQRVRGKDESPQALRNLFGRIVRGDDFFMPSSTEGGFPVY